MHSDADTIVKPKRKLPRFVPVIFANGVDDDYPGLFAALNNDPVQFDERIYEPGEDIRIENRDLVVKRALDLRRNSPGRVIYFTGCVLYGPVIIPPQD